MDFSIECEPTDWERRRAAVIEERLSTEGDRLSDAFGVTISVALKD